MRQGLVSFMQATGQSLQQYMVRDYGEAVASQVIFKLFNSPANGKSFPFDLSMMAYLCSVGDSFHLR